MKKLLMVASTTFAIAALAIPATASASGMFYHEGQSIEGTKTTHLKGPVSFIKSAIGSLECEVDMTLSVGTSTGSVITFTVTNPCVGTGAFQNCEVTASEAKGSLTPTTEDLDIKEFTMLQTLNGCAGGVPAIHMAGELTAIPDNYETISSLWVSGTLMWTGLGPVIWSGELEVDEEEAGTLGLTEF